MEKIIIKHVINKNANMWHHLWNAVLFNSAWYIPYQHHNRTHGVEATIGQKLEHNIARQSKKAMSLLNIRHSTITRTKNFTEEIKPPCFLQHVKYQDLLTDYVRVIRKHGGEKVNLHTILVSLKLKYIKIDFHFGSISIKKLKIKFKVTHITECLMKSNEAEILQIT